MFAGKTTRLIDRLAAAAQAGRRVAAFKHAEDTRYDELALATHDGRRMRAIPVSDPAAILAQAGDAEVIGIDEGHFFELRLLETVEHLRERNRRTIITGLDHDMWGRPLPPFPELKRIATLVQILHVPCTACGRPARYSQRVTPIIAGSLVGGIADYEPRCRACFVPADLPAPAYGQRSEA